MKRYLVAILYTVSVIFLVGTVNVYAQSEVRNNRIPVEPMPWRNSFDIIEGWDWSLPPGIKAIPYSGTTMPWSKVNGKRYDLPGKELTQIVEFVEEIGTPGRRV